MERQRVRVQVPDGRLFFVPQQHARAVRGGDPPQRKEQGAVRRRTGMSLGCKGHSSMRPEETIVTANEVQGVTLVLRMFYLCWWKKIQ